MYVGPMSFRAGLIRGLEVNGTSEGIMFDLQRDFVLSWPIIGCGSNDNSSESGT